MSQVFRLLCRKSTYVSHPGIEPQSLDLTHKKENLWYVLLANVQLKNYSLKQNRNQIHKNTLKKYRKYNNKKYNKHENITRSIPTRKINLENGNKTTHTYSSRRPLAARATDRLTGSEQNHYITKLPTNQWRHEPKFSTVALCVQ